VKQVTVEVSAAQINDLVNTPVEIVPAPGAGKVILPMAIMAVIDPGNVPFYNALVYVVHAGSWTDPPYLNPPVQSFWEVNGAGFFDQADPCIRLGAPGFDYLDEIVIPLAEWENQALLFVAGSNDDPALTGGGDGTLTITTLYTVIHSDA